MVREGRHEEGCYLRRLTGIVYVSKYEAYPHLLYRGAGNVHAEDDGLVVGVCHTKDCTPATAVGAQQHQDGEFREVGREVCGQDDLSMPACVGVSFKFECSAGQTLCESHSIREGMANDLKYILSNHI